MTTAPAADPPATALELLADCINRLRMTDPSDTPATLPAAWHGFGTVQAAGTLPAKIDVDLALRAIHDRSSVELGLAGYAA